jgi:hypothetical protein
MVVSGVSQKVGPELEGETSQKEAACRSERRRVWEVGSKRRVDVCDGGMSDVAGGIGC